MSLKTGDKLKPGAALDWLREDSTRRVVDVYGCIWSFDRNSKAYRVQTAMRSHEADLIDIYTLLFCSEVTIL